MFSGRAQHDFQEGEWTIHNNGFFSNHKAIRRQSFSGGFARFQCDSYKSNGFVINNPAKAQQMIYASDLPFNKEVIAELVEGPLNFENNDGELSFFARMKEFPDDSYYHMQYELNRYVTTRSPDINVPKDGDYVIAACQGVGYRGRVVHSDDDGYLLYLIDHGIERLVKEMWLIDDSKNHAQRLFHLSGAVVECQLAGVQFKDSSSKEKVRQILNTLHERSNVTIRLTRVGFNGKVNLVKMLVQYDPVQPSISDFGLAIIKKDLGVYASPVKNFTAYSRSELLQLRDLAHVGKDFSVLHRMNIHKDDIAFQIKKHYCKY